MFTSSPRRTPKEVRVPADAFREAVVPAPPILTAAEHATICENARWLTQLDLREVFARERECRGSWASVQLENTAYFNGMLAYDLLLHLDTMQVDDVPPATAYAQYALLIPQLKYCALQTLKSMELIERMRKTATPCEYSQDYTQQLLARQQVLLDTYVPILAKVRGIIGSYPDHREEDLKLVGTF